LTLEEARPKILASLKEARAREEARRRALDFVAQVKSAGGDFEKAARASGMVAKDLKSVHPGGEIPQLGLQPAVTASLFRLKPGEVGAPVSIGPGVVVTQFLETSPGAVLPLEKVHERVAADLLRQARVDAAKKLLDAAGGSSDLATLAKRMKLEVKKTGP